MPANNYFAPPVIVMTPDQLSDCIAQALRQGAEILREELRRNPEPENKIITGRKAILEYLGLRPKNYQGLRARMDAYPSAFTTEGRNTIFFNVGVFEELKRREAKMTRRK